MTLCVPDRRQLDCLTIKLTIDFIEYLFKISICHARIRAYTLVMTDQKDTQMRTPNRYRMDRRDYAWYRMDSTKNLMVINSIMMLSGALDFERLKSTIESRLPNYEKFTQKVETVRGTPYWVSDDQFHIDNHISLIQVDTPLGKDSIQEYMSTHAPKTLDGGRPLWHMSVIDKIEGGGFAIVFRLHHCITDGLGLMHVLKHLTDDHEAHGISPALHWHPKHLEKVGSAPLSTMGKVNFLGRVAGQLGRLAVLFKDADTSIKGPLSGDKELVWLPALPIDFVRNIARRLDATINDVWVAAVSGALREYLAARGENVDKRYLRAAVTFNLREKADAWLLGNEFGLVSVELPTNQAEPTKRLKIVNRLMTKIKQSHQPHATMAFLSIVGSLPHLIQKLVLSMFTSKGSVVLTNIEGPAGVRFLAGAKLSDLICWVPQAGTLGVGFALISYAQQIQLGIFVDKALVADASLLGKYTLDAFDALDASTRESVASEDIGQPLTDVIPGIPVA